MLYDCIGTGYGESYEYMLLAAKYCSKNAICIKRGLMDSKNLILRRIVKEERDSKWFKLIFDLSNKVNTQPRKNDFENAMAHAKFTKISKEWQTMIKEKYNKFYPK